ncbi:hypothetical protein Taro_052052 [Colocasia esculenta]|uniref:Uncharacterized protein n=1 Tax=Colocasia esculenta TaxID=4460 RepID=A0A843XII3_COLES|nr:hypothetical protein [Colocasia esculenta]
MEDAPIEGEQLMADEIQGEITVASRHTEVPLAETPVQEEVTAAAQSDVPMENVPVEEEFLGEKDGETQGEGNKHPPENQFRDGETASSSDSEEDQDQQPPVDKAREKGKAAASEVPLITDTPFQRQMRQRFIINLKPVIERLDAQGEILCSVQSDVNSIFMSQASTSKELSQVKNAVWWFNKEMGSMKSILSEILKAVGAQAPPPPPPPATQRSEEDVPRPSGPAEQVAGPSGPAAAASQAEVTPEPPAPSSTQTRVPPSPPSSSTAPPAPQTFKKPQPRTISSPTPFPSQSTSSPASSTPISPPPPVFEVPPISSSAGASSSSGPPSSGPSDIPPTTSHSFLHPSPPPSFITIIPKCAQLDSPYLGEIKDEFEEVILQSVLKSARFPPRDHSLTLSEWFQIHHKNCWAPFIQKEIKMATHFQLFNNYWYVHRLPEVQLSQFKQAIRALGLAVAHTEAVQVDFATLQLPKELSLPPIHSLIMESSVGSIIFERFARVMGRIKVQKGYLS